MIVSIHQPAYLPWLGYLHRIAVSDLYIVLDHVQFEKNSFINRNKVRTKQGWCWLTVPVETKGRFGNLPIREVGIARNIKWADKHWQTICQNYGKSVFFDDHADFLEHIYHQDWAELSPFLQKMTNYLLMSFGIDTQILYSSDLNVPGSKEELVLNLCRKVGATTYLSGPLGRDYLDVETFSAQGIKVVFDEYEHPIYRQVDQAFEPYMASLDLLCNHGPRSREIMMANQPEIQA